MPNTNHELVLMMKDLHLSSLDIMTCLDVPLVKVIQWTAEDGNQVQQVMPEEELHLLKFSLMTENKRSQLF